MTQRLDSLQALRGIACLAVAGFHAALLEARFGLGFNPLGWLRWCGYAGVDLFFVLSGVLIAQTARAGFGRPDKLPAYLFRRCWRIYPTYWIALPLAAGLLRLTGPLEHVLPATPTEWRDELLLLPQAAPPRILAVAWTLSYELMFYLAVGGLFLAPRRAAVPLLFGWAAVVVTWTLALTPPVDPAALQAVSPLVLEFLAGAAIGLSGLHLGRRAALLLVGFAVCWAGIGLAATYDPDPLRLTTYYPARVLVFGPPAALLVAAGVCWDRAGGRPLPRWLRFVGDASYSVYLIHVPVQVVLLYASMLVRWPHSRLPHLVWDVGLIALPVAAGLALHLLVERPLLRLVQRRRSKPQPGQRPAASAQLVHPA